MNMLMTKQDAIKIAENNLKIITMEAIKLDPFGFSVVFTDEAILYERWRQADSKQFEKYNKICGK